MTSWRTTMSTARTTTDQPSAANVGAAGSGRAQPISLASASPRRAELMALMGWSFEVCSADIDESPLPGETPLSLVRRLAQAKAVQMSSSTTGPLIVAADTVVVVGGQILGKPADRGEAAEMLARLRGRQHQVITAIAVFVRESGRILTDVCETPVLMREYSEEEAQAYVYSDAPLDKAGGYGIQDDGFSPVAVDAMHGCYANVMGLPLCHLTRTVRRLGWQPSVDMPEACRQHTHYPCTVFPEILEEPG